MGEKHHNVQVGRKLYRSLEAPLPEILKALTTGSLACQESPLPPCRHGKVPDEILPRASRCCKALLVKGDSVHQSHGTEAKDTGRIQVWCLERTTNRYVLAGQVPTSFVSLPQRFSSFFAKLNYSFRKIQMKRSPQPPLTNQLRLCESLKSDDGIP